MKIEHHPDASTLMSYSAGSLPEALGAVVAAHLDLCQDCALEVKTMDRIGASLFERIESVPLLASCSKDCGHLPSETLAGSTIAEPTGSVVTRLLGRELAEIHWKRLGSRIWHYPIKLSPGSHGDLRLIKVAPGQVLPEHGHGGSELTLILDGAYSDEYGNYRIGDVSDLGDDVDHRPISDSIEGCVCLIASDQKARFKDVVSRIFQPITGL